jgi:hypothetical protein
VRGAVRLPSEAEGLALAVAAAMLWAKLRTSTNMAAGLHVIGKEGL